MCRGAYIPHSAIYWCPLFSENYFNPHAKINKIINPKPSQLISRKHSLIFLWTSKGFIYAEFFLNFFLNLYIRVAEKFQIYSVKITSKEIYESKNWICPFLLNPQAKLSPRFLLLSPRKKEITHSSGTTISKDIFSQEKEGGGEDIGVEKIIKIQPTRVLVTGLYRSHHLCNLYIFALWFFVP